MLLRASLLAFLAAWNLALAAPRRNPPPQPVGAPSPVPRLTLERVFASPALSGSVPQKARLSPDGRWLALLRPRPDDRERQDLWGVDTTTGESRLLVDSLKLGSGAALSEAERMRRERARIAGLKGIVEYGWTPDGKSLLVPLDGDIYLAGLDGAVRRLTDTPDGELDPRMSERGRFVSFVRNNALHVVDLATGQDRTVASDASPTVAWGLAEFVAQEELDRDRGYWWSPDDRRLAVARVDEAPVETAVRAAIGPEKTAVFEQRYPRAGTPNARVTLHFMDPDGGNRVQADLGPDADIYLARVDWLHDGSGAIVQRLSRDQRRLDFLRVDPRTGAASRLFDENALTWIDLDEGDDTQPLAQGGFLFSSQRSGFRHLYRWQDGRVTPLTAGPWAVRELVGVDEAGERLYFTAYRDSTVESHVYALDLRAPGATPERLTPSGTTSTATAGRDARRLLIRTAAPTQPPQVWLADGQGRRVAWVEENAVGPGHPWAPFAPTAGRPRFGTLLAADGQTRLDYRLLLPRALPAGRRAPVLVRVYGGPHAHDVNADFVTPLDQYLQQQGWIVFQVANRGGGGRGVAFEAPIHRRLGETEVADQLAALAWLKRQSFVDPDRVAVFGWSYGGYMVLKLLAAAPHAYAAGVAVAPVTRWELYDTAYTERYLGNPATDPAPYRAAGALDASGRIDDPLLLVHGLADDNVLFDHTSALMAKMQEARQPFELMLYPGKAHAIPGASAQTHLFTTIEGFLDRRVKAKGGRDGVRQAERRRPG